MKRRIAISRKDSRSKGSSFSLPHEGIVDCGFKNADCGIQTVLLICILLFSIRNPRSEIRNNLCSGASKQLAIFNGKAIELSPGPEDQVFYLE
jgi:hypothetical protein